jgi:hypothetical protein
MFLAEIGKHDRATLASPSDAAETIIKRADELMYRDKLKKGLAR